MSSEIEELVISEKNTFDEVIEFTKILLNKSKKIKLIANRKCSVISAKVCENLVELGYVEYENIQTKTDIEDEKRKTKLIITLKRANKFEDLFNEKNIKNKNHNIIKGEIEISNEFSSKKLIHPNDKKINEDYEIYINDIKINTYYYRFPKKGNYNIKYIFNKLLSSTRSLFYEINSIKSLDLSNFDAENVTDMAFMFRGCESLTNINLSNFNTKNVTDMYQMFCDCKSLTNLDLSNLNTKNVTDMSFMFCGCYSLVNIDLSNFNTQNVIYMHSMFSFCESLINLDLSNFNTQKVTKMYEMFKMCKSLINLNLSNFSNQSLNNLNEMFNGCNSLINIDLGNFNTKFNSGDISYSYRHHIFNGCNSLIKKNIKFIDPDNNNLCILS